QNPRQEADTRAESQRRQLPGRGPFVDRVAPDAQERSGFAHGPERLGRWSDLGTHRTRLLVSASVSFTAGFLLFEAGPALIANFVVAGREEVADIVVLIEPHRLAVGLDDFRHHLRQEPALSR